MITEVLIENFRCFGRTKIKGFGSVNLIGGQNNSGKTALLEALFLCMYPTPIAIALLRKFRNENDKLIKLANNQVWDYLFFNQDKTRPAVITTNNNNGIENILELLATKNIDAILQNSEAISKNTKSNRIMEILQQKFANNFILQLKGTNNQQNYALYLLPDVEEGKIGSLGDPVVDFELDQSPFFHTHIRLSDQSLASLCDVLTDYQKTELESILNKIDNSIVGYEIGAPGGIPLIRLKRANSKSMPIGMFGDAVRRLIELMLVLLTTNQHTIFIDEIENGIHYTAQQAVWDMLFKIADERNIQIFATTHNKEMIESFAKIAQKQSPNNKGVYFELYRNGYNGEIVTESLDSEAMLYAIKNNEKLRGA